MYDKITLREKIDLYGSWTQNPKHFGLLLLFMQWLKRSISNLASNMRLVEEVGVDRGQASC